MRYRMRLANEAAILLAGYMALVCAPDADSEDIQVADSVEVTILSSNSANTRTVGEWGFSALVEVNGHYVLFDTGNYADTVLWNAAAPKVNLSRATDVVLSHFHPDHMGGLVTLFEVTRTKNPNAMRRIHVAEGFFHSRRLVSRGGDAEWNRMIAMREQLEAEGVEFRVYSGPTEIVP